MRIVFLNLADRHDHGLAHTSTQALKKKYGPVHWATALLVGQNSIELYDVFDLFEASTKGTLATLAHQKQLAELREACRLADKVMLAAHGNYGDTVQVSASPGWDQGEAVAIGSYKELAAMMRQVLLPQCSYRLSLIICYAARSKNHLADHSDPSQLSVADIRSSFAFKFFAEICTYTRVQMTARIGAVEFDSNTGSSLVRTEAATSAQIEFDEMQKMDVVEKARESYDRALQKYRDTKNIDAWDNMEEKFVDGTGHFKPSGVPANAEEVIIQQYHQLNGKANELTGTAVKTSRKYGKLIYRYLLGRLAVFAKYPTERIIYAGPL